jgi:hypothetical protein
MKYSFISFAILILIGCKSEKGADSNFQKEMISLGQDYLGYKKSHNKYEDYKVYHDTILQKMRRLTIQKRLDTVTAIVSKIDSIGENSYEVRYLDGIFVYNARVIFKDNIEIKKSPFYQYRQALRVGQVVDLPLYMFETSGLGIDNNHLVSEVFNMRDGSIEIEIWPIPDGVKDIKEQMQKDLFNTWSNNATSFE